MKVADKPQTSTELRTKLKAQKLEQQHTKEALKQAQANEEQGNKRFKRTPWADVNPVKVVMVNNPNPQEIAVELYDTWTDVKQNACEQFGVNPDDYTMAYQWRVEETKIVRKKEVKTCVGEFPFWGGSLFLVAKQKPENPSKSHIEKSVSAQPDEKPDSSSGSSGDSSDSDES